MLSPSVGKLTIRARVGYGFFHWTTGGSNTWRPPLALQCLPPLLLLAGLYWVPESPRWLIMKGRREEAEAILMRLHDDGLDPEHRYARAELYQITKQIELDRTFDSSWLHIMRKPSLRKRAFLTIGTTGFVQCSGVLVINNYGPTLYRNLGFSTERQLMYPAAWLTLAVGLDSTYSCRYFGSSAFTDPNQ